MMPGAGPVRIERAILEALVAHARESLPDECCGLLIGAREPDGATRIRRAVRARNVAPSPRRYVVDPSDHFAAIRAARVEGLDVVGAYHSHPGAPAVPSRRDLADAHDPELLHVIVSVEAGRAEAAVGAYRLTPARALPVAFAVSGTLAGPGAEAAGEPELGGGECDHVVTLA